MAWAAALVGVVALVLGLLGIGSSTPSPVLGAGSVTVAGHDPAVGGRVPINLDHQIPITVRHVPAGIGTPERRNSSFRSEGLQVVRSTAVPFVRGTLGFRATMDASAGRYIVGGKLADLEAVGTTGNGDR